MTLGVALPQSLFDIAVPCIVPTGPVLWLTGPVLWLNFPDNELICLLSAGLVDGSVLPRDMQSGSIGYFSNSLSHFEMVSA